MQRLALRKMASICPVKMSLHTVIPKENFRKRKTFPTTVKTAFIPKVSLQLFTTGESDLKIKLVDRMVEKVTLYHEQVNFNTKDAQGKELNFTNNCKEIIPQNRYTHDYYLGSTGFMDHIFNSASSDINIEVKMILLEAKFGVINEVVIPPCSYDLLTVQALITQERFNDVKITITTEQEAEAQPVHFFAHKDILVTKSPVIAKMFECDLQESATSSIIVSDIEPEVFKEVLSFIYTNQVPNLSTMAAPLLYAAEKYQLDGLKVKCEQFLSYTLQVGNAVQALQLAQTYNASQLKENVLLYIAEYIDEVRESSDWAIVKSNCDLMDELIGRMAKPAAKRRKDN